MVSIADTDAILMQYFGHIIVLSRGLRFSASIDTVSVSWVSLCLDVRVVGVYIHYRPFLSVP